MTRVLLTTSSFQDTPGPHHDLLAETGWEIVRARGPLGEAATLALVDGIDGCICGDDAITRRVIERARPRLKAISKYGIGVDRIDVAACTECGVPVLYTPGVNHTTVAEHAMLLLLALEKHLLFHTDSTRAGGWERRTGRELSGRTIGLVGLGRIGQEVAIRARAFGMRVVAFGNHWDADFATRHGVERMAALDDLLREADIISLHTRLTPSSRHLIGARALGRIKPGAVIINCARGELIDTAALVDALRSGRVRGYAADVLDEEPPRPDHPLPRLPNCIITPHIGSRTVESVVRQATAAVQNLILVLRGDPPLAQVNPGVVVRGPA